MSSNLLRQTTFRIATLVLGAYATALAATGDSELTPQRAQFPAVWEAAQHAPGDSWRKLAMGLEDYPLYPYLELASLQRRLPQLKSTEVEAFLKTWPDSLPAAELRDAYLFVLAKQEKWKDFLNFYPTDAHSTELRCDALHAHLALGQPPDFKQDIEPLWLSANALPAACDPLVAWARQQHKLDSPLIWQRIDLAMDTANSELVATLAGLLNADEQLAAQRIASAIHDPATTLAKITGWPDAAHTRDAIAVALDRLARHDSDAAETLWSKLGTQFHFDKAQQARVLHALALYRATSYAPNALARLAALPTEAIDDTTREWRVRVALAAQDWNATLAALDALSDIQKIDPRWRYLRARILVKLERPNDAAPLFAALADEANFYGFLAADWLQQPYAICPIELNDDVAAESTAQPLPELARAFEFFALNHLHEARREWDFVIAHLDNDQRRRAVTIATQLGWYDRAVYTLNKGDDLRLYNLRFPLARRDQVIRDAKTADVDPAWAYAIIRAESAWASDAHSSADAYGLMQLLPGTAAHMAKLEKISYGGKADLYNADTNIAIGTHYLGNMATHFNGSQWLASAAYNAGPDPVERWLSQRGSFEPDFFIETIPYKETREYVARILAFSVIYDWRLHGSALPLAARLPHIGQTYTSPNDDTARKAVVCPAAIVDAISKPVPATAAAPAITSPPAQKQ